MSQAQTALPEVGSFAAMFEESLQRSDMRAGEVISAEVVRVEHNFVVVNAGASRSPSVTGRSAGAPPSRARSVATTRSRKSSTSSWSYPSVNFVDWNFAASTSSAVIMPDIVPHGVASGWPDTRPVTNGRGSPPPRRA